ncbi:Trypsin-like peptidase domain-containing protein [Saccharicrinis carchari]|uniref:Trypsin-like peptidase domain-containing protein n=1 Tax=Saccharicrinis carchari TaxID=1168039 RepID=A0A521C8I9_SACCC|nr:serine protease [Saccharicrinis carchari]SMO55121.1 Trypsin-like peptidase domain-containing protein [Saccharicrinis carchari]
MKIKYRLLLVCMVFIYSASYSQVAQMVQDQVIESQLLKAALDLKARGDYVKPQELESQVKSRVGKLKLNSAVGASANKIEDYYEVQKNKTLIIARLWNQPDGQSNILYKSCAFPITSDGVCVTNHHVFRLHPEKMEDILYIVMDYEGNVYEIEEVLTGSYQDDMAVFKLKGEPKMSPVAIGREPKVGDKVKLVSHPAGSYYYYSQGYITRSYWYADNKSKRMSMTADFSLGSSGAPICDINGNLVGVVANTYYLPMGQNPQIIVKEFSPVSNLFKLIGID